MKRLFSLALAVFMLLAVPNVPSVSAESTNTMEIYGLNLSEPGDSTLLNLSGNWLLIDTGSEACADELINHLKNYGVEKLDIFISHLHDDHYGGVAAIGECEDIAVDTIYLPHQSIGSEYEAQSYFLNKLYVDSGASKVEYLKRGSELSFGGCTAEVLGPVGEYSIEQFSAYVVDGDNGDVRHYLNNCSLTTKFTCGDKTFLTTGDIQAEEEKALVEYYKDDELNADVLKLAHHGVSTSSTTEFLAAVSPDYSFALNSGYSVYSSRKNAAEYGVVYMVADEKENLAIKTDGKSLKAYKGSKELTGWVSLVGGKGNDEKYNKYYIKNGISLKGLQTIGSSKYYFLSGGCMLKGSYTDGVYSPWRKMSDGTRAFAESGEMYVGFKEIDGNTFYFDTASGLRVLGSEDWKLVKIGSKYYALNQNGTIRKNGWLEFGNKQYRYFGSDGAMKTGWFTLGEKKYYLNTSTGYREVGLKKIGSKYYYFEETNQAAYLRTSCWKKFGTKYRYFGSDGVMKIGWKKIGGKYYYFDKSTGYSYTKTGLRTIDGKKYYMQKSSKGSYRYNKTGWKKFGKKYRYFGKNGVVTTGWKKISGKYYYFDKSKGYSYTKTGLRTIGGKKYYMQKSSKGSYRYNKTGWKKFGKKYRYFGKNGVVTTGWKKIGKSKYYFDKNGYRVTGTKKINGKTYKFSKNGKLKK